VKDMQGHLIDELLEVVRKLEYMENLPSSVLKELVLSKEHMKLALLRYGKPRDERRKGERRA